MFYSTTAKLLIWGILFFFNWDYCFCINDNDTIKEIEITILDSKEYLWDLNGDTINLLDIPFNRSISFKSYRHKNKNLPILTNTIKNYVKDSINAIWEQKYFTSPNFTKIIIASRLVSTNISKSLIEVYDRNAKLLWFAEQQEYSSNYCIIPDTDDNIGIKWSSNYEEYSEFASKLVIYDNQGIPIDSIANVGNITQGTQKEHIYFQMDDRIPNYDKLKNSLYYYNMYSRQKWDKALPFDNRFVLFPISDDGQYIICASRNKLFHLSFSGNILNQQINEELNYMISDFSEDGLNSIGKNTSLDKIHLFDNQSGKLLMQTDISISVPFRYIGNSVRFIKNYYAIAYMTTNNTVDIALYNYEGKQVGLINTDYKKGAEGFDIKMINNKYVLYFDKRRYANIHDLDFVE